jgi:phage shock protein A
LLKQYLREAEIALNQERARLEAVREEGKSLRDNLARHEAEIRSLDEDITLALAGGKEDLARFAIRRIIPRRNELKALRSRIEERSAEEQALSERVTAQQVQFENLRTRVRAELAREDAPCVSPWPCDGLVADEEVEIELMRRRQSEAGRQT